MDRAQQFRQILCTRGLSLHRVSQKSAKLFGRSSEFYVPHNLYSALARTGRTPTICQILAVSQITGYRLADWLAVFGFELDAIFRLRLLVSRQQTFPLDATLYDPYAWVSWFRERPQTGPIPPIAPLTELLAATPVRRARELLEGNPKKFFYAVVGGGDSYALPYFAAGSLIRADPRRPEELLGDRKTVRGNTFFLVEHGSGWTCSRLVVLGKNRVLLHCPQRPCLERELKIGSDAHILGAIDAEIRPMTPRVAGVRKSRAAILPEERAQGLLREKTSLEFLLRQSRMRAEISFREASALSRWIAETLSDEAYFAAVSTLSDYEILARPPRQIQKIITLCLLYGIEFEQFLRACGLPVDQAGREPIPDEFVSRCLPKQSLAHGFAVEGATPQIQESFSGQILGQWEQIPIFLRFSLNEFTGLKNLSLSDLFWVGGDPSPRHPLLVNAAIVAVNRRARKPKPHAPGMCDRPLHLVLTRGGSYVCGRCTLDEGNLVIDGYPRGRIRAQKFRNGIDAEVAGQVTAILRRLR